MMRDGQIEKAMIIGKGSLFLGRMTNLFDGVSFVIEKNSGVKKQENSVSDKEIKNMIAGAMRQMADNLLGETE
jgi:hypothetical protein